MPVADWVIPPALNLVGGSAYMCYLYWIHLPEHTNIMTQGYIGVSNAPKRRLWEHHNITENPHLQNAFNKYNNIKFSILLQGDEDYCYIMEEKIRPDIKIGWNINKGGACPPKGKHFPKGDLHPMKNPYNRKRHSQIMTGRKHSPETIEKIRKNGNFGKKDSPETINKKRQSAIQAWAKKKPPKGLSWGKLFPILEIKMGFFHQS